MGKLLTKNITNIYAWDDYGGIVVIELDWQQDVTWERGELNDGYSSIQDYFNNKTSKWYETIEDCFNKVSHFTGIENQ
ncbi:hypothetical protein Elgi_38160 [Paenibacillus elgii]|uniref:hypothetical protein n=1 Tax=Paenibacillus elgii TaxID=189691 RepID=UPI002D7B7BBD|nr:hypothetical protein Elgi_38160 [Paenibacillus elgii]